MTRNMIEANRRIFRALDDYCSARGDPIENAGSPRWIATKEEEEDRIFLRKADLSAQLSFTSRRAMARFDRLPKSYFCAVGFENMQDVSGLAEQNLSGGMLTAVLSELRTQPRASTAEIRDVVAAWDNTTPGYPGHDAGLVVSLFPKIRFFSASDVATEETWRIFFMLCLAECRNGETWINDGLVSTLQVIAELEPADLPYRTLCRSIFDADPAAMFLALYRCLEALYAFSGARDLIAALDLNRPWPQVAVALEDHLGWYPREQDSLTNLLELGIRADHELVFEALGESPPESAAGRLPAAVSRRIYKLRNELVHFRPAQHQMDHSGIDWNRLCEAAAGLVCFVYAEVFPTA
jgi:hypothetical protein